MRGLRKPWPPANVSPDNQPPRRFADAEREYMAALRAAPNKARFARAEFDRLDKGKLRQVMYDEQGSVCVYCESGLVENESPPHVEHWRPLSCAPDYAIHWPNLYLSCPSPETCDVSKGARRLKADDADPELPWPTNFAYERIVGYSRGGDMYVREDVHVDEETRRALELAYLTTVSTPADDVGPSSISITQRSWRHGARRWTASAGAWSRISRTGPRAGANAKSEPLNSSAGIGFLRS